MMMNICNCHGVLVNAIKSNFQRQRTLLCTTSYGYSVKDFSSSPPLVLLPLRPVNRCFSYNSNNILYKSWKFGKARPIEENIEYELDEEGRSIVYTGSLHNMLLGLKMFSITTTTMGMGMLWSLAYEHDDLSIYAKGALWPLAVLFTFLTPLLVHLLARKYVAQIVFEEEKNRYTAITYNFLGKKKELPFKVGDIEAMDLVQRFTTAVMVKDGKKIPLFIVRNAFVDPFHYKRIMHNYEMTESININKEIAKLAKKK